jgi:putative sterol carrier protein
MAGNVAPPPAATAGDGRVPRSTKAGAAGGRLPSMARFLSDEWIAALDAAATAAQDVPDAPGDDIEVAQVVEHPDGEVAYRFCLEGGRLRIRPGRGDRPTVTLRQDLATATAIARGERSAQQAFMAGEVRVGGDLGALIEAQGALTAYDAALEPVRAATTYDHPPRPAAGPSDRPAPDHPPPSRR